MFNFLCADTATSGNSVVIYVILIVMVVAMLIFPYFTNKKRNQQYVDMLSSIKVGDLVKTAGGIIGRVTKITDKGEIKTIILETGSKSEKSYMEFDMTSIYCVLKSNKVEDKKEETAEKSDESQVLESQQKDDSVETKSDEVHVEEKSEETKSEKPKKPTAKKATTKKATKTTKK